MKGDDATHKKCGFAYIKALPNRRSECTDMASDAGNSVFGEVRLIIFFLKNAKPRKKTGAFTQKNEEMRWVIWR